MSATPEQIDSIYILLSKIKKLAEHPNTPEHEAAAAALKYRSLLLKYGLSEEKIKQPSETDDFIRNPLKPASKLPSWYKALAVTVAQFLGCAIVTSRSFDGRYRYELSFCGRVVDTWRAIDLFISLAIGFQHHANTQYSLGTREALFCVQNTPHKWKTSFLHGCVTGLNIKIHELEKASAQYTNDKALMIIKTAAADSFVTDSLNIKEGKPIVRPTVSRDAYKAGIQTGLRARILPELASQTTE